MLAKILRPIHPLMRESQIEVTRLIFLAVVKYQHFGELGDCTTTFFFGTMLHSLVLKYNFT